MSPHRLKARGGAGSKISLPHPSISPPLTCKILQERRALRKLLGPPHLADHPLKPSLLPARRVPINTKEITRHKEVPAVARVATAPSHKYTPCHPFKKLHVGHGVSTSSMLCRGNGSASAAFCGATRVKRNPNVNVVSKHTGKPDAPQARLSRALACRTLRNKTGEKRRLSSTRALKCVDHEKTNIPAQQNCDSTSAFRACEGFMLSNESCMQHSYNVELNEDDCNINLKEETPVWFGQDLPSNFKSNYDRDQVDFNEEAPVWFEQNLPSIFNTSYDRDPALPLSSFYKIGIDEPVSPHNLSTRSGNRDGFDTHRLKSHSNANHQEFDRSRDACKMSRSPDGPDIVDVCSSGDSTGCKSMSQTQNSNQVYSDNDQKVDLSDNPRILGNDASDILNDICTPHSIASSQEFYVAGSSKNACEKQRTSDEVIFDNPCKFRAHRYARLQECNDTQSSRIGLEKPRGSDLCEMSSSRNHGKGGACDSIQNDDDDGDACKFGLHVNAIIQDSDHNRSRGNSSSKLRSHPIEQAAFESPWCDVDACEFAVHKSFADYQEIDEVNSSGNVWVAEHDQSSSPNMLSLQMDSMDIKSAVEKGKHIHGLQEKLALLEDSVSYMAANLKKTSGQLDAKIDDNALLLSCIQSKLSSIEGLVTRIEAFNCEDLRD